jgi:hypothetical protein
MSSRDITPIEEREDPFTPADADGHAAAHEEYQQERAERQERLHEDLSIKAQLEQKAAEQTHTIDVLGLDVTFRSLPSDDHLDLLAIGERFQSMEGDDDIEHLRAALEEMRDRVAEILADNVTHEDLQDADWWVDTLSLTDLVQTGVALGQQADEVEPGPEDIDGFRDE